MSLLLPDSGLLFWMTIVFLVVFFILWRWGFPSIIKMVNERKNYIDESLAKAEEANLRLANIQKQAAIRDIRSQVAELSVQIAEKILRKQLTTSAEQAQLIDSLLDEVASSNGTESK